MKKSDLEKLVSEQQVQLDRHKARVKAQNDRAKENWDIVSCRLPKGTRDRIKAQGLSTNGFINSCVLKELEHLESGAAD